MQPNQTMIDAALAGMTHVLDLVPTDKILVVTDETTFGCGWVFWPSGQLTLPLATTQPTADQLMFQSILIVSSIIQQYQLPARL